MEHKTKIIVSGGGTGGHVFPAIAIANAFKAKYPDTEILFIGANDRMEMQKVPQAGYKIIGLPIKAMPRKISLSILKTMSLLMKSRKMASKILQEFKPNAVVGVGGYASFAVLNIANKMQIPTLIQEQNSYAGVSNKLLAKKAKAICVAYPEMEKFFPKETLHFTGNPVRNLNTDVTKQEALDFFKLKNDKKTIFITGGSLGARTINESILPNLEKFANANIQLIWQTGSYYFEEIQKNLETKPKYENINVFPFIDRMDLAFKAADLVISRAGAISISELALLNKPAILIPSPNVAEDHQTKNARALTAINAAIMVPDIEARQKLADLSIETISNEQVLSQLSESIAKYAKPNAAEDIVNILSSLIKK